ncbi:hypothetical protein HRbin01_01631 [archaeon HR01]|nr:hypothetical protein HRbin01_01631 [archaeon HR01]
MKTFLSYGLRGTPTYFLIRPDSSVALTLVGEQSYEILRQAVESIALKS